jgi:hypothetical protein
MERFWTHFMPAGELIRGSDVTWMPATDAYTGALRKVVAPSIAPYPASRLTTLLSRDQPTYQADASSVVEPPRSQPETDGGGIAASTIGLVGGGALAVAVLVLFAVRRRRRMPAHPSAA